MGNPNVYDESSFRMLKGLEPVRERPGMYTRTDSCAHIIQEVIDNACDEALAGFAKTIEVEIRDDQSVRVSDDGRGIPVGLHPEEKIPVVVMAYTKLHAGGKFNKKEGSAYSFAGGLHGVGVTVTTALSHHVRVQVSRDRKKYEVEFKNGGRDIGSVNTIGTSERTGTSVEVWPDFSYFIEKKIPVSEIEHILQTKAVLLKGITINFTLNGVTKIWTYERGLVQYLEELTQDRTAVAPLYNAEKFQEPVNEGEDPPPFEVGEGGSFAFGWFEDGSTTSPAYVNLIPIKEGTHISGLKAGVYEAVKAFIDHRKMLPKDIRLQQEDVAGRMAFVLSAKVLDPQFQGQTKERLNNREAHKLIMQMVKDPFELWLNNHVEHGTAIADLAIRQAISRQKNGQKVERRRSSGVTMLPGKLVDCEETTNNELFFVEGDSAGGTAKKARNKDNQAVLPLRGKVLNTWEVDRHRLFANTEVHDISTALGVEPHTLDDDAEVVLKNLRYTRAMIMTDADVDGAHIQVLLLTLFIRHFPHLVDRGHVWIVQPPLYRIDVAPVGKTKQGQRLYALDAAELDLIKAKLTREKVSPSRIDVARFKGLGEMNEDQLEETAMDPDKRRAFPVYCDPSKIDNIRGIFNLLMGKTNASGRRGLLSERSAAVQADV